MTETQVHPAPGSSRRVLKVTGIVGAILMSVAGLLVCLNWTEVKARYYIWSMGSQNFLASKEPCKGLGILKAGGFPYMIEYMNDHRAFQNNNDVLQPSIPVREDTGEPAKSWDGSMERPGSRSIDLILWSKRLNMWTPGEIRIQRGETVGVILDRLLYTLAMELGHVPHFDQESRKKGLKPMWVKWWQLNKHKFK